MKRSNGQKMKYGRYPYTITRVKVMKSLLLDEGDYMKMHNMGYNQIAHMLNEGTYKNEINELAGKHSGIELIELALNRNFARTIHKLLVISNKKEVRDLIEAYSLKWLLNNFKLILKVKMGIIAVQEMDSLISPIWPTEYEFARHLVKEDVTATVREIADHIDVDKKLLLELYEKRNIIELENEIDKGYYRKLLHFARHMKLDKKDPLRQFFSDIVTLTNIKTIIRMRTKNAAKGKMLGRLVVGRDLKKSKVEDGLLEARDMKEAMNSLKKTKFKMLAEEAAFDDLSHFENLCDKFLYSYAFSLIHKKPMSVSSIFGFLLLKEIEVRNMRLFIHSKALGLEKGFIDSNIIVG